MFHSYFNEYAFALSKQILLTSSCTLHRRKFLTNVSVHICNNFKVLCYRFLQNILSISFKIQGCLKISVDYISTFTFVNTV